MKLYTISYLKFGRTFEVYPQVFCVFLRANKHAQVQITVCTLAE